MGPGSAQLCFAVVTPLGCSPGHLPIRRRAQQPDYGQWVRPLASGGALVGRLYAWPGGRDAAATLAALPGPSTLAELPAHAAQIAGALRELELDGSVSLVGFEPTASGIRAKLWGGGRVWCLDRGLALVSPDQTLPTGAGPPVPMSGLGPTGVMGGATFEAPGDRFLIAVSMPPLTLEGAGLPELTTLAPEHRLEAVARVAAARVNGHHAVLAHWDRAPRALGFAEWQASWEAVQPAGVADSWAALGDPVRGLGAVLLVLVEEGLERWRERPAAKDLSWGMQSVSGTFDALAGVGVLGGAALVRELLEELDPAFSHAVDHLGATPRHERAFEARKLLSLALVRRACGGAPLPAPAPAHWLGHLAERSPPPGSREAHDLALLALAAGVTGPVPTFLGGRARAASDADSVVRAFAHGLAAALERGAPPAAVRPIWRRFVRAFPRELAAGNLGWAGLLAAGAAFHHRIGGAPLEEVCTRVVADAGDEDPP